MTYRNYKTADWEFLYTPSGGPRTHVINRGTITSPTRAYGFWWATPANTWDASYHYFQTMMDSFQPSG